jgi:hypothetical protein
MNIKDAEKFIRLQRRRKRAEERAAGRKPPESHPTAGPPQPWDFARVVTPASPVSVH